MVIKQTFLLILFFFFSVTAFSVVDESGIFTGRVSKVNSEAKLVRLKIDFINMKYLNKGDKVEFWSDYYQKRMCESFIIGKTNNYLLIKINDFDECSRQVHISDGSYLKLYSQDLVNNLMMGKELFKILEKKRLAMHGKMQRAKSELDRHMAKIEGINSRYSILREKIELEWRQEIALQEEERLKVYDVYSKFIMELEDIDKKMERYRIADKNLTTDRWALDDRLYFEK